jgi:arginine decarboxylase
LRFPQILSSQLKKLSLAYHHAIHQFQYQGEHWPVFPMKVNPRREVVETFLRDSSKLHVGLECGSKAELYAAVAQEQSASATASRMTALSTSPALPCRPVKR